MFLLTTEEKAKSGIFEDHTSVVYTLRKFDGETGALLSEKSTGGHERFEDALLYSDGSVDSFAF